RFQATLRRVRRQLALTRGDNDDPLANADLRRRLRSLLSERDAVQRYASRLMLNAGGRVTFLRAEEIDWIQAAGNYVEVHSGREKHLLHESLSSVAERLDPAHFARIHRSTIVNIDRIRELQPWFHGDAIAVLRDGTTL